MDEEFVNLLLKEEEGLKLEYKQQISSQEKIAKTLSSMSNAFGGMILIGISDKRKIIGIDPEEEQFMIATANDHFCTPKASYKTFTVKIDPKNPYEEEKYVLIIQVYPSEGQKIFVQQKNGLLKAFLRVGNQNKLF